MTLSAGMRGSESWSAARVSMLPLPEAALARYEDEGVLNLDATAVLRIPPFTELGTPVQLIGAFGGRDAFVAAVHDLQSALYREVA